MKIKIDINKLSEGELNRLKNYGCENRIKHKISQHGDYVFYCAIDDKICNEKPTKCFKRLKHKHKPLTAFLGVKNE